MIIIFDGEQLVTINWGSVNKKWLEDRGYKYTKMHTPVCIHAKDLMPSSKQYVRVMCDYCGGTYDMEYCRCKQV